MKRLAYITSLILAVFAAGNYNWSNAQNSNVTSDTNVDAIDEVKESIESSTKLTVFKIDREYYNEIYRDNQVAVEKHDAHFYKITRLSDSQVIGYLYKDYIYKTDKWGITSASVLYNQRIGSISTVEQDLQHYSDLLNWSI